MSSEEAIGTADLIDASGISPHSVHHWTACGYLRPEMIRSPEGYGQGGHRRRWPPAEVEHARRMVVLVRAGLTPGLASAFARESWPRGEIAPGVVLEVTGDHR